MPAGTIEDGLQHLLNRLERGQFSPIAPSSPAGAIARQCEVEPAGVRYTRRSAGWNDVTVGYNLTLRRAGEVNFAVMKELITEANSLYRVIQAAKDATYEVSGDADYDWNYEAGTALTMLVTVRHSQPNGT